MERTVPSTTPEPIKLDQSIIVRAGAGAGKTTALTEHVLDVAREFRKTQDRYPRIVVTTFTKKATQELKERLVLLALKKHHDLLEFVNSSSALKISTIHGILDQFLRQYGGAIELDPSFSVINSSRASQLARQVIRKILLNHSSKESLQTLIDEF
jgi:ATP-dependent helicase/nuclease subunit A